MSLKERGRNEKFNNGKGARGDPQSPGQLDLPAHQHGARGDPLCEDG